MRFVTKCIQPSRLGYHQLRELSASSNIRKPAYSELIWGSEQK